MEELRKLAEAADRRSSIAAIAIPAATILRLLDVVDAARSATDPSRPAAQSEGDWIALRTALAALSQTEDAARQAMEKE